MLTVRLNGMIFRSKIGVFQSEKALYQSLRIDLSMQIPRSQDSKKNRWNLNQSIDYSVIYAKVQESIDHHNSRGTNLLETIAEDIAQRALSHTIQPISVTVSVSKLDAKLSGHVANIGCRITRPLNT
jgi:dihydroneopterin aldolase